MILVRFDPDTMDAARPVDPLGKPIGARHLVLDTLTVQHVGHPGNIGRREEAAKTGRHLSKMTHAIDQPRSSNDRVV